MAASVYSGFTGFTGFSTFTTATAVSSRRVSQDPQDTTVTINGNRVRISLRLQIENPMSDTAENIALTAVPLFKKMTRSLPNKANDLSREENQNCQKRLQGESEPTTRLTCEVPNSSMKAHLILRFEDAPGKELEKAELKTLKGGILKIAKYILSPGSDGEPRVNRFASVAAVRALGPSNVTGGAAVASAEEPITTSSQALRSLKSGREIPVLDLEIATTAFLTFASSLPKISLGETDKENEVLAFGNAIEALDDKSCASYKLLFRNMAQIDYLQLDDVVNEVAENLRFEHEDKVEILGLYISNLKDEEETETASS